MKKILDPAKRNEKIITDNYLDVGDNVYAKVIGWLNDTCGNDKQWFIHGECQGCGKRYAKIICCGKEWCSNCGKVGSIAHNRRYARWLSKIMHFKKMRYIIFTIPESIRFKYRDPVQLSLLGHKVQEMLKRHGFERGLRRWHWFGDKSHKFHPHLNVLVEGEYLDPKYLNSIKTAWARILNYSKSKVDVRIRYKITPEDMASCLYYVTRSTFLDYNWDIELAMKLRNFRNMVVWGRNKWIDPLVWSIPEVTKKKIAGEELDLQAIDDMVNHRCPYCKGLIIWKGARPIAVLNIVDKINHGAGYYTILDRSRPPDLEKEFKNRLFRLKIEWLAKVYFSDYWKNKSKSDNISWYQWRFSTN